jgi:hypothetical protein
MEVRTFKGKMECQIAALQEEEMLLAINLGIAKHVAEAFPDYDRKIYIATNSSNTNKCIEVLIFVLFVILGKSAFAVENNEDIEKNDPVAKDVWVNKIYDNFHEDLSLPAYKEVLLNLTVISRLTDFPKIKGDMVGYSVQGDIMIPVRIIDGIEDEGFAARSLLNEDNEPEINFSWKFLKYVYKYHADIFDIVFKFTMYHETAHILNGDIYKFSIFQDLKEEIRADSYAADRLRTYCEFDSTLEAFLSIHQMYNAFIDHVEDSEGSIKNIALRLEYLSQHRKN